MLLSVETVTSVYHPLSKYPAVQSLRFWMRVDEVHIVDGVVLPPDQLSLALDTYNRCLLNVPAWQLSVDSNAALSAVERFRKVNAARLIGLCLLICQDIYHRQQSPQIRSFHTCCFHYSQETIHLYHISYVPFQHLRDPILYAYIDMICISTNWPWGRKVLRCSPQ